MDLTVSKSQVGDITVYKLVENYNTVNMEELSAKDARKIYEYSNLNNDCWYIFKVGDDLYSIDFSIPLINSSSENMKEIEKVWEKVVVNDINLGSQTIRWQAVDLTKY